MVPNYDGLTAEETFALLAPFMETEPDKITHYIVLGVVQDTCQTSDPPEVHAHLHMATSGMSRQLLRELLETAVMEVVYQTMEMHERFYATERDGSHDAL